MAVRLASPAELPEGFSYKPEFLSGEEEGSLLRTIADLEFRSVEFQGYVAKRRIVDYGFEYDFTSRRVSEAKPLPEFLSGLRERAAQWAGVTGDDIREAIIIEYPPGAPMGWHRDVPQFEIILGISLGAPCRMRLKPYVEKDAIRSILLEPRSIYCMRGPARWNFQHSIAPVEQFRYSITFRTLREKRSPSARRAKSVQ